MRFWLRQTVRHERRRLAQESDAVALAIARSFGNQKADAVVKELKHGE
jgi:hypothetical protein